MNIPRVYFDNVAVSGRVLRDLNPFDQMAAVDDLMRMHAEGRIKVVTSKVTRIEQQRTSVPEKREKLEAHWGELSAVSNDHRLIGFHNQRMFYGGLIMHPRFSDIVNDDLFATLKAVGLADNDAKHVMYACEADPRVSPLGKGSGPLTGKQLGIRGSPGRNVACSRFVTVSSLGQHRSPAGDYAVAAAVGLVRSR